MAAIRDEFVSLGHEVLICCYFLLFNRCIFLMIPSYFKIENFAAIRDEFVTLGHEGLICCYFVLFKQKIYKSINLNIDIKTIDGSR